MASAIDYVALPDCFGRPSCDPAPACPACGGLECLCRPRFFAGQLLTEDDLNRLDHYIQAKNRLHNRYLHGWGVACGLEVVCGVCEPDQRHVIVKPGYALSPCGNDIVVCGNTSVDICDLISRCRPPVDDCNGTISPPPPQTPAGTIGAAAPGAGTTIDDCGGGTEEWILAVCYTEKPSRGMAALRATPGDCACGCGTAGTKCRGTSGDCGCGCGGSRSPRSSGGCGCGGGSHGSHGSHAHGSSNGGGDCGCGCGGKRKTATPRSVPEQCEPTVTCEGTRFVVYKAPKKDPKQREYGAAARRFLCCLAPLLRDLGDANGVQTPAQAQAWALAVLEAVREFITSEGLYDCRLAKRLSAIAIPAPGTDSTAVYFNQLSQSVSSIVAIAAIAWQKCFCGALLPPCPPPSQSDCVPLATITVSRSSCCVLTICNLSARKFLVTIPNIQYWLSFLDLFSGSATNAVTSLRQALERLCCRPTREYQDSVRDAQYFRTTVQPAAVGAGAARGRTRARTAAVEEPPFATTLLGALGSPERRVGIEHLLLGALGARDAQGRPFVSEEEMVNPSNFLVLNQVVAPLLRAIVPSDTPAADLGAALGGVDHSRLDELSKELASLKSTVSRQEKTIAALKKNK